MRIIVESGWIETGELIEAFPVELRDWREIGIWCDAYERSGKVRIWRIERDANDIPPWM